jgi:hypothetical protein
MYLLSMAVNDMLTYIEIQGGYVLHTLVFDMNTVQNAAIYSAAVPVTLQSFVLMLHNR